MDLKNRGENIVVMFLINLKSGGLRFELCVMVVFGCRFF